MKVETDVEMIGFGREGGGCLGAPFPKLSNEDVAFLIYAPLGDALMNWHTCESLHTKSVDMLLFSLTFF